jgi:signal transduction histidine kinase/CheY-like chemotaxis protein
VLFDPAVVFAGTSELAALMRVTDWAATPLGPVDQWPAALRSAVRIVLTSRFSMWMAWGDDLTMFYNDRYRHDTLGSKHPAALARSVRDVWKEIWSDVEGRVASVFATGESTWDESLLLLLERSGYQEETYHTFSYSPLHDDVDGVVKGLLCVVNEDTERLITERRVTLLGAFAAESIRANTRASVFEALDRTLAERSHDLPFTLTYLFEPDGTTRLAGATGFTPTAAQSDPARWALGQIALEGEWPKGPWPHPARHALVVPIVTFDHAKPAGLFVAGLNPMRAFNEAYGEFITVFARQLGTGLANADAYMLERARANALAELDRTKTAMRLTEERQLDELLQIFEQAPVAIAILRGPQHVYYIANPAYRALVANRELVGVPLAEAVPEVVSQGHVELLDNCYRSGEPYFGAGTAVDVARPDGTLVGRFFDILYQPMRDATNAIVGIAVIAHEVTALTTARRDAENANRAKDEFLAMLGHELRNPLAPITSALHLMRQQPMLGAERERSIIEGQVDHLVGLVDDLLDISRITRGKVDLRVEPLELAEVVARAVEIVKPWILEHHHTLVVDVPTGLVVRGDRTRLTQVFSNLLTNAAKYTPASGTIAVRAQAIDSMIAISVADTGIGIEPDMLDRVFEAFIQAPQTFDRATGGLGLGLAIVANLVLLHNGQVTAASKGRSRGSVFTVTLPKIESAEAVAARPVTSSTHLKGEGKVLIVDDNSDAAELLGDLLGSYGYHVSVRFDGASALADYAALQPEIAILDLGLPMMDGFELARKLRALSTDLKLIAVTGYGQASDREKTAAAGFSAHLVKPVDLAKLRKLLEEYIVRG